MLTNVWLFLNISCILGTMLAGNRNGHDYYEVLKNSSEEDMHSTTFILKQRHETSSREQTDSMGRPSSFLKTIKVKAAT